MAGNQSVGRVSFELTADVVKFVNKLHKADKESNGALMKIARGFKNLEPAAKKGSKGVNKLSDRLKNMGQTAALVSGPMGGISSRLSVMATIVSQGPLIAGIAGVGLALTGIYKVMSNGLKVLDDEIMQMQQLEATLKSTGYAAGITSGQINTFARTLALDTLTSIEEARKAMAKLSTMTSVTGNNFFNATKIAEDLAASGFGSLTENVVKLGRVLSDPIKEINSLTRFGITFSNAQKDIIIALVKENKLYEAQTFILKTLGDRLGEVAKAQAAGTIAGQVDEMGQRWDELTRIFGAVAHGPLLESLKKFNIMLLVIAKKLDANFDFKLAAPKTAANQVDKLVEGLDAVAARSKIKIKIDDTKGRLQSIIDKIKIIRKDTGQLHGMNLVKALANDIIDPTSGLDMYRQMFGEIKRSNLDNLAIYEKLIINYNAELKALKAKDGELKSTNTTNLAAIVQEGKSELEWQKQIFKWKSEEFAKQQKQKSAATKKEKEDELKNHLARLKAIDDEYNKQLEVANKNADTVDAGLALAKNLTTSGQGKDAVDTLALDNQYGKQGTNRLALYAALNIAIAAQDIEAKTILNAALLELDKQYATKKAEIEGREAARKKALDLEVYNSSAEAIQTGLSALSDMFQKSGEDHKQAQKNLFLTAQAVAFALNVVNTMAAVSKKRSDGDTIGAATELTQGILRGVTIAATAIGAFHGGTDSLPKSLDNQSFLLKAGERVVQPQANKDLTEFLKHGNTSAGITISAPVTIQGNVTDQRWFQSELIKHRQLISASVKSAEREKPNRR